MVIKMLFLRHFSLSRDLGNGGFLLLGCVKVDLVETGSFPARGHQEIVVLVTQIGMRLQQRKRIEASRLRLESKADLVVAARVVDSELLRSDGGNHEVLIFIL
jgi:hypothetical protein